MTKADAERWNARYIDAPVPAPRRPEALTDTLVAKLPSAGRALDVACGAGAQAAWLADHGFDVHAVDVSHAAVELASTATAGRTATVQIADLDDGIPADLGDFDLILCQRFHAPHLYDSFASRLVAGGVLILTVLSQTGAATPGCFHAPSGELLTAFTRDGLDMLLHIEADGQESIVARRTS